MKKAILAGGVAILVASCQTGAAPRQQVQFCLTEEANADELRRILQGLARKHDMEFTDRSAETERELRSLGDLPPEVQRSFPIINLYVRRSDGLGIGGGNSGLPSNQVVLGFTTGGSSADRRLFVREVLSRLELKWNVQGAAPGEGARPLVCAEKRAVD